MDDSTNLKELIDKVEAFRTERNWHQHHDPKELTIALSIEVSELLELFRYKNREEVSTWLDTPENKTKASHELSDIFYHVLLLAKEMNLDLSDSFNEKLKIIGEKYPVDKCYGKKLKYTEL